MLERLVHFKKYNDLNKSFENLKFFQCAKSLFYCLFGGVKALERLVETAKGF